MVKIKSTKQRVTSLSGIRLSSGLHQQLWSRIGINSRPTFYSRSLLLYLHSQHWTKLPNIKGEGHFAKLSANAVRAGFSFL